MIIHNVGNKVKGESLEISTEICDANNEVTNQYLKQFFFSTFKFDVTYKFKDREPFKSQVKAVNTIIGKNFGGKTLTEAIDELRVNNNVRDNMCRFDRLVDIINNYIDKDGNRVELQVNF